MTIEESLMGVSRLGVDTTPLIYHIEAHPRFENLLTEIFGRISDGELVGVTSVISLSEVLVHPLARENNELVTQYMDLLLRSNHFETVDIDRDIAVKAANLRAKYRLRTPDALQVSAALVTGCEAFLTNDYSLMRVEDLRILVLSEMEDKGLV